MSATDTETPNPLLAPSGIADFPSFRAEHVVPGVQALVHECSEILRQLEEEAAPTWKDLAGGIERINDRMNFVWGLVGHFMSVRNTPELREANEQMQPKVIECMMAVGQSRPLFDKLNQLKDGAEWATLEEGQKRAVNALLHEATLAGVALEGEQQERFNTLQQEMAELSTTFANHVIDATKAFHMDLSDPADVEGLPPSLLAIAAQASEDENATAENGPWRITLDGPVISPFLMHSRRRELREKVMKAYTTRASEGELNNGPIIADLLRKRRECAKILGYGSWADMSLSSKMAPDVAAALKLGEDLRLVAFPAAERELEELKDFARAAGAAEADEMMPWDRGFWAERMREARFDFEAEALRPYFPMSKVMEGLFELAERLFGITLRDATGKVPGWHADVTYYEVLDGSGAEIASFFMDPYARSADKRGGAWMNDGLSRTNLFPRENGAPRLPVAYVVCNFTPPVGDKPALLSFGEVETTFHEFGHALQHMLTQVEHGLVSGIENVEWDAVELPSQFMENWCYHEPTLMGLTSHVDTGDKLPKELFDKIVAARTYRAGSGTLRQLQFGLLDMELHHSFDPDGSESLAELEDRLAELVTVGERDPGARPLCAFGHIFSGGYSAGYYSYKWAEVLSADAFAAFEEVGLDNEAAVMETGRRFAKTVLGLGGSRPPMDVFKEFRGREPKVDALMRHTGLVAAN